MELSSPARPLNAPEPNSRPPRFPLVFRVGVVGHRPNRLDSADMGLLEQRIRETIEVVQTELFAHYSEQSEIYANGKPLLRAISPLAEGVDRLFADQALAAGCELCAVLPFRRDEYELDFVPSKALEPDSRERFHQLLDRATSAFELDGSRHDEPGAYGVAGRVVLNQSDLLMVVWDGERRNLRGGTEETFDAALTRGVPIVWIDAHAPHHWQLVGAGFQRFEPPAERDRAGLEHSAEAGDLRRCVRGLIELPSGDHFGDEPESEHSTAPENAALNLRRFLNERQSCWNFACWWKLFRDLLGDSRFRLPKLKVIPFEQAVEAAWPRRIATPVEQTIDRLRPFYAWPDKLADRFADRYRSAFVVAFLLAAFAVAMALLPIGLNFKPHGIGETASTVCELLSIVLILVIVICGRKARWQARWLDYRLLAEMVRHLRMIVHLGGERAAPSVPAHLTSYGDPATSWMAWYLRGLERTIGLPNAVVDRDHLRECLQELRQQLESPSGQIAFHFTTAERSQRIEHRLERIEVGLLTLTLLACVGHLAPAFWHQLHYPTHQLTFLCGFFPALGAALAGIANQGEFRRISKRSKSMQSRLQQQLEQVRQLEERLDQPHAGTLQFSVEISALARETARLMVSEVLDWRVMFQDRPLHTT